MRITLRSVGQASLLLWTLLVPALAQNVFHDRTSPAVAGPDWDVSLGYSYVRMPIPGESRIPLHGITADGRVTFNRYWGGVIETGYVRTPDVLDTGHQGYLFTALGGPVFYPANFGNTKFFVEGLAGMGLVDGAVPKSNGGTFHGWQSQFAWGGGGGVEHTIVGPFAARFHADLLRTSFYDSAGAIHPQNNLRLTVSVVYRLRSRLNRAVNR
jgi:hypothetical protein